MIFMRMCEDEELNLPVKKREEPSQVFQCFHIGSPINQDLFSGRGNEKHSIPLLYIQEMYVELPVWLQMIFPGNKYPQCCENSAQLEKGAGAGMEPRRSQPLYLWPLSPEPFPANSFLRVACSVPAHEHSHGSK